MTKSPIRFFYLISFEVILYMYLYCPRNDYITPYINYQ